ncbi:unnamed protein product, partial [Effrenium voratum]
RLLDQQPRWLRISSPCHSAVHWAHPGPSWESVRADDKKWVDIEEHSRNADEVSWAGYCTCCKRPLSLTLTSPSPAAKRRREEAPASSGKFAYVVCIWGFNPEYVLGAMVLAHSLKRTGTKHDMVLLHTSDVPVKAIGLLERCGWKPREVEYVEAVGALYGNHCREGRFADVFTKLRVFGLFEYEKVLLMDADLLVCSNIDELFELPAPAAMGRGPWSGYRHGQRMNGSYFFGGTRPGPYGWNQSSGINAGVMLLQPCPETLSECLAEVADERHPEHIQGNGPEQDYLSRYFAGTWRHISVAYNFQLHQMYYVLSPECVTSADRAEFLGCPEKVKVFHYSSEPKPWARLLDAYYASFSEEEWLLEVLSKFSGYRAWVMKDAVAVEREADRSGIVVGEDGKLHHSIGWEKVVKEAPSKAEEAAPPNGEKEEEVWRRRLGEEILVPESAVAGAEKVARRSLQLWEEAYHSLTAELGDPQLVQTLLQTPKKESQKSNEQWRWSSGWWVAEGTKKRLSCSCTWLEAGPQVLLTWGSEVLLSSSSEGLFVATLLPGGAEVVSFAAEDVERAKAWASDLAEGLPVALALAAADTAEVPALKALAEALHARGQFSLEAGLGCPSEMPSGCRVACAAGKSRQTWQDTNAGWDYASASMK